MVVRAMLPAALALVLAQAGGAWGSGRPPECAEAFGRTANVWERAKSPELGHYCDLVASAASKLAGTAAMAEGALAAAHEADGVLPGHAAPKALEGRALAALGRTDDAFAALTAAKSLNAGALEDPPTLLAWARVLARTGHREGAAEAFRALLPRASALSGADRAAAATEAGLVALTLGPASLDAATAALREVLRDTQDDASPLVALALALALDRGGAADEARALLADRAPADPRAALATARAKELLAVAPTEGHALLAFALESSDPAAARTAWGEYLAASPASPWAAHARAHAASAARPVQRGLR